MRSLELLSRVNQTFLLQFCAETTIQLMDNVPIEAEHRGSKKGMRRRNGR